MEQKGEKKYSRGSWDAWRAINERGEQVNYEDGGSSAEEPNFILLEEAEAPDRYTGGKARGTNAAPGRAGGSGRLGKPWQIIVALVLVVLLAGGSGFAGGYLAARSGSGVGTGGAVTVNAKGDVSIGEAIAEKVLPSVVGISTTAEITSWNFFGYTTQELPEGVGTGIIVDDRGYILTNAHVISDGDAKTITVSLTDGTDLKGTVLWYDSTLDLAIVKVEATGLTAAELGDSDTVKIGAYAAAIGNPLGLEFDRSFSQGVISGLNRSISVSEGSSAVQMEGLIQTDAAINSGNSGGPLLNSSGQVVGINSAKAANGEGMGFAIPINTAKSIIEEVIGTGDYSKAYIGISGTDVATYLQYYPDEDLGTETGAYVIQIFTGTPAAASGLKEGDVVTAIDDTEIETMTALTKSMYNYEPGEKVTLTVIRDGKKMKMDLTLGESNQQQQQQMQEQQEKRQMQQ